jgi:hypothetical protein
VIASWFPSAERAMMGLRGALGYRLTARRLMMKISGAFVYQPPATVGRVHIPPTFAIALTAFHDNGSPVFLPQPGSPTLGVSAVLSYPEQLTLSDIAVTIVSNTGKGYVEAQAILHDPAPAGWDPAALLISVNGTPEQIITAAAPARTDAIPVMPPAPGGGRVTG